MRLKALIGLGAAAVLAACTQKSPEIAASMPAKIEDVYDAAEWSCLTEISGLSIAHNSAPVRVPDFTRGGWDKVKGFGYAMK